MKKLILVIALVFLLTSCSNSDNYINTSSKDISAQESSSSSQDVSSEDKHSESQFLAYAPRESISPYDFETAYKMCVQAITEFRYARAHKEAMKFTKYIIDSNLISYMKKSLTSPHIYMCEGELQKCGLIEFDLQCGKKKFDRDRMYLNIAWGSSTDSYGFSTSYEFIVENYDGRLVIVEWYDGSKDTFDNICRGVLDIKDNDIYWKNVDSVALNKKVAEHIKIK